MPRSKMVKPTKKQILEALKEMYSIFQETSYPIEPKAEAILKAYKLV